MIPASLVKNRHSQPAYCGKINQTQQATWPPQVRHIVCRAVPHIMWWTALHTTT